MTIRIVTDSTADLPAQLAKELDITIVPLYVIFGEKSYRDRIDISEDEFYEKLMHGTPFVELQPLRVPDPSVIRGLFEDLQTYGVSGSTRSPRLCATIVELLLLLVAETGTTMQHSNSVAWSRYEQCRQFIVDNSATIQTLEDVCETCNLDKAYLCRLFKRFSNESPYQLLTRLKMARAAELLLHSDLLAKEVAPIVGFDDPYHFSKVFKRTYGMGPAAFRERGHR